MTASAIWIRAVYCLFLIFFPTAFSIRSFACECLDRERPCEYLHADAVFVGRVIETVPAKHFQDKNGYTPGYSMRFAVDESLRGGLGTDVNIETGGGGGDCGTPLRAGEQFLIFAYKEKDGTLWTGMCSGNRPLRGNPGLDRVVDEYRALIAGGKSSIFGRVELVKPAWRGMKSTIPRENQQIALLFMPTPTASAGRQRARVMAGISSTSCQLGSTR